MQESLSVVIPTYNRAAMLRRTLPSYLTSSSVVEVILVDDASSEDTRCALKALANTDPRIVYLRNDTNLGCPESRNSGIDHATGQILLMSEDDVELGAGFLETLVQHMCECGADIIAGRRVWMRAGESREQALNRANQSRKPIVNLRWLEQYSSAITTDDVEAPLLDSTMLVRRRVLEEVRYFGPLRAQSSWREDSDFQLSAVQSGYRLFRCPHAICFHHIRRSPSYGANRLRADVAYLRGMFRNNVIFLKRHYAFLVQNYPQALVLDSPSLTSVAYVCRRAIWLARTEALRSFQRRGHDVFEWQ